MKNKRKHTSYKKGEFFVIEFSTHRLKLASASLGNKSIISYIDTFHNPSGSEEEFIRLLEPALKNKRIKRNNIILSLDRSFVTIRFVTFPSADAKEIDSMVQWQAVKLIPYKIDQIIVSHRILQINSDGSSYVILVIVPRPILKKYIGICQLLNLYPDAITITSEGLLGWCLLHPGVYQPSEPTAIIDIGQNRIELAVMQYGEFIFSRSTDLSNAPRDENKIIEEIGVSLDSYYKQAIYTPLKKVVIVGDKKNLVDLPGMLRSQIDANIQTIGHLDGIPMCKNAGKDLHSVGISFASIAGLALNREVKTRINLLPQEIVEKKLYIAKKKEFINTIFLLVFSLVTLLSVLGFDVYGKKKIIDVLDRDLERVNPKATELEQIKKKISAINNHLKQEGSCIDILRELHIITPKEIFLNTFIYEEGRSVIIKGAAPSMSVVFNFVPVLNGSDFFENVRVRYATQRKMTGSELTDFEIVCPLKYNPGG